MKLINNMRLSQTMIDAITVMEEHGGKLVRWDGGFWTFDGATIQSTVRDSYGEYNVPNWYCTVKSLRALEQRKLVKLDEQNKTCLLISE